MVNTSRSGYIDLQEFEDFIRECQERVNQDYADEAVKKVFSRYASGDRLLESDFMRLADRMVDKILEVATRDLDADENGEENIEG